MMLQMRLLWRGEVVNASLELAGAGVGTDELGLGRTLRTRLRETMVIQPLKVTPKATYWPASRT